MKGRKINWLGAIAGLILLAVLIFALAKAGPKKLTPREPERLRVVATFFPLYDFAKNVGRERIGLAILFAQTPEVASFTPADIAKINRADLIIKNGLGLEPVIDELIKSSDNKDAAVVDSSVGVTLPGDRAAADPHIWLDPQNAIIQTANIRDALAKYDPPNADFYKQNARAYITQLLELDKEIEQEAAQFEKKDFVAFHPAFTYFAKRYGLNQAAVFEEFPGKEPSPKYLAGVIKTIKGLKIEALFAEPQFSPKVMEVIAADLGLTVRELNPIETGDLAKDSYLALMRKNLQTLREVMH